MPEIQLVIFDFDGVVVDSEVISARMLVAELAEYGVSIDLPYVAQHFLGRSYPVVLEQIRREFTITLPQGFEADYRARLVAAFRDGLGGVLLVGPEGARPLARAEAAWDNHLVPIAL